MTPKGLYMEAYEQFRSSAHFVEASNAQITSAR